MSNIDKRAQKELYTKVEQQAHSLRGNSREYQAVTGMCPVNVIEMQAQKIQALLDELEVAQKLATQQGNIAVELFDEVTRLQRSADDKAPELREQLEAAEKRIAELERELVAMEAVTLAMRDDMRSAAGKGEAS